MPTTTLTLLKPFVAPLPQMPVIQLNGGTPFNLATLFSDLEETVQDLQERNIVRRGKIVDGKWVPSAHCGLALMQPLNLKNISEGGLDDIVEDYFWGTAGFGPDANKMREVIANAGRKNFGIVLSADEVFQDTLTMQSAASLLPDDASPDEVFPEPHVLSAESDGTTLWGVFPYGGAVMVVVGKWCVLLGVSGYTAPQDHIVATIYATRLAEFLDTNEIDEIIVVEAA